MEVYLIRHTETANEAGLCFGQSDIGLAESFAEELEELNEKLPELENCRVFSSPLSRCLQLAKALANEITTDERLKELYFGDWENVRFDAIEPEALQLWMDNFATASPPNDESFVALYERTGVFWQELLNIQSPTDIMQLIGPQIL